MNYLLKKITFIIAISTLSILLILTAFFVRGFQSLKNIDPVSPFHEEVAQLRYPFAPEAGLIYDPAIIQKYEKAFVELQSNYEVLLWGLVEEGKKEYEENKDTISIYALGNKYLYALNELEKKGDQEVKLLLEQLSAELKQQNQDLSLVEDIEKYYIQSKYQKRRELLNKVKTATAP
ncbi:hypothetical protein [Clostridium formicaceticum]|uniref:Uncharacterized protein n=1 Tax=Clostridium formicaceticum TaxID=1497 RepID=A0AAC9WEN9_9CLOT|nr:hypothetical protein [Clostridium formicaceticum]AOY75625.1 hypothetical protein BJL90_06795 [Clostridium formicaceticum]ARE85936.1 hypothetical protein CLFO_02520 [Clostridium formicaceticum]